MQQTVTTVEISNFIPPRGMRKVSRIVLPVSVQSGYEKIVRCGCRLTCETLGTGVISLTVEEPRLGDFVIKLVNSTQEVEEALTDMIEAFNEEEFDKWKSRREQMM